MTDYRFSIELIDIAIVDKNCTNFTSAITPRPQLSTANLLLVDLSSRVDRPHTSPWWLRPAAAAATARLTAPRYQMTLLTTGAGLLYKNRTLVYVE